MFYLITFIIVIVLLPHYICLTPLYYKYYFLIEIVLHQVFMLKVRYEDEKLENIW